MMAAAAVLHISFFCSDQTFLQQEKNESKKMCVRLLIGFIQFSGIFYKLSVMENYHNDIYHEKHF